MLGPTVACSMLLGSGSGPSEPGLALLAPATLRDGLLNSWAAMGGGIAWLMPCLRDGPCC